MTADRWEQVEALFEAALVQPSHARSRWLETACTDADVRAEVRGMLAAHAHADRFLEMPAQVFAADLIADVGDDVPTRQVGPYRLVEEIGRGGMGAVYRGERVDGQFEQRVAVKLLRPGPTSDHMEHRFLAERRILASLHHPHIAPLIDGGLTDDGAPYFVMEYVHGRPIDQYCAEASCTLKQRLRLFLDVCDAVAYAHRNLVVHRDLKPANILVVEPPPGGSTHARVKLLDFGIAKLLDDEATPEGAVHLTQTGLHLMTPEYASPEQVRGEAITTASDVYQLGLLLYLLLTGERPYRFKTRALTEIARVVCEVEPPRPSDVVYRTEASAPGGPSHRWHRQLRGDLDAIVRKALRKEPDARYASVEHLAEDVHRYLHGLPVAAHDGTWRYRLRTFVRRHRSAVTIAAAFVILLVGYAVMLTRQQAQTARERDRAEQYAAFLTDLFASPDPFSDTATRDQREITVREFLDQGVERVRNELSAEPETQAALLTTIADVYEQLGYAKKAKPLYDDALAHYERLGDGRSAEAVQVLQKLAWVTGDPKVADSLFHRQLALARDLENGTGPLTAHSLVFYGKRLLDNGKLAAADSVLALARPVLRSAGPDAKEQLTGALYFSAIAKESLGALDAAETLILEAYDLRRTLSGETNPQTAVIMTERAGIAEARGEMDEAARWKRRALSIFEETLGDEHPYTIAALNNLAVLLDQQGTYEEAEALLRRVVDLRREVSGPDHAETVGSLQNLAANLVRQGKLDEAEPLLREVHMRYRQALPPDHYLIAFPLLSLTDLYLRRRAFDQAEATARSAYTHLHATLPEGHPLTAVAASRLGEALTGLRRFREAEPLLLYGHRTLHAAQGYDEYKARARQRLVTLYEAWGRPDAAASYREDGAEE